MKVQDLARELGKSPKAFMVMLDQAGIKVKSGSTKFDAEEEQYIRTLFAQKKAAKTSDTESIPEDILTIELPTETITLMELSKRIKVKLPDLLRVVLQRGMLLNLNSEVDLKTATEIAESCDVKVSIICPQLNQETEGIKSKLDKIEEDELENSLDSLVTRPPVVTIMGHVDHGKTKLLDAIRQTNVVDKEAGGITQHIGAYQVVVKGKKVTFLDTPGHAAFTTLRARGAQVTDIAILVVAADEGVKPQTIEALHHAQAANVQIIVALNKIDKPEADIEHVKQQLTQYGLVSEEWGGKTVMVPISAKAKQGIDELLDMILLVGDMLELQANPHGPAKGVVIESRLSRQKGPVATVLVKSGSLKIGDFFMIGSVYGKVRALLDDLGKPIQAAGPGSPVELLGISEVPGPGEFLEVFESEKICKLIAQEKQALQSNLAQKHRSVSLESFSQQIEKGEAKAINVIVKADVHGSLEAIVSSIKDIKTDKVSIQILHAATGEITENDIMLARASAAIIIGFGVSINSEAQKLAEEEGIEVKLYAIIYQIMDDLKKAAEGLFSVEYEEVKLGQVEVRNVFKFSKIGKIAGCYVTEGKITKNSMVRLYRQQKEVFYGKLASLKRFKDDAKEVLAGFECGIVIDGFNDFEVGDVVASYEQRQKGKK